MQDTDEYILWLLDSILLVGASNSIQGHLTEISSRVLQQGQLSLTQQFSWLVIYLLSQNICLPGRQKRACLLAFNQLCWIY